MPIIVLKIHLDFEKNSAINGRMVVDHYSKIIKILELIVVKNVSWIDQNVRLIYKMRVCK